MNAVVAPQVQSRVLPWGNALGLRITKTLAKTAGVQAHSAVRITAEPGRIVIESEPTRPTLADMLAQFDPARHSGEVMAFVPVGKEVL